MAGFPNRFGQTSSSPFGSLGFGQASGTTKNPFAPTPFGVPTPFGSHAGNSMFGGTSTGKFGAPSSTFPSTTFGYVSPSPAFGNSMPAFGVSSTPAFGNSPPLVGGSSAFHQNSGFGGFGSNTTPNPFGVTNQQSQGSSLFVSMAPSRPGPEPGFYGTSTPVFGLASTPAFGSTNTLAFGAASTPACGTTGSPSFGSTANPPAFGSTGVASGVSSTPGFGSSNTSIFCSSSTPAFGVSHPQNFAASSTPSFNFVPYSAFGQSTAAFGSSPFGAQSSTYGSLPSTPSFASSGFGQAPVAMPVYKEKSHEELRWEDYQSGDKGGALPSGQQSGPISFRPPTAQSNPFGPSSTSASLSLSNPFVPKGFGPSAASAFSSSALSASTEVKPFHSPSFPSTSSGAFATTSPSLFGPSSSPSLSSTHSLFACPTRATYPTVALPNCSSTLFEVPTSSLGQADSGFRPTTSVYGPSSTSTFGPSNTFSTPVQGSISSGFSFIPSGFTSSAQGTTSAFNPTMAFPNSSPTPFQAITPSLAQTGSLFGPTTSSIQQSSPLIFGPCGKPASSLQERLFSSTPSLFPSANPVSAAATPFQPGPCSFCLSRGGTSLFADASGQDPLSTPFGTRTVPYLATDQAEWGREQPEPMKLHSISAMAAYNKKSHEELRFDDYQWGVKGGQNLSGQAPGGTASTVESNPAGPSSASAQSSANPSSLPAPASQSSAPNVNALCLVFVFCSLNQ
ncbi:unnamed protein product [Linum trigynum]|uniref:Uncharacterized protein n=1 Tax=Linum trigynum TaxID=586398 RepID=A0AAV2DL79_9ROSI